LYGFQKAQFFILGETGLHCLYLHAGNLLVEDINLGWAVLWVVQDYRTNLRGRQFGTAPHPSGLQSPRAGDFGSEMPGKQKYAIVDT
jgi:hypothetical protein